MRRPKEPLLDKPFDYLVDPIARFLRIEFACSVVRLLAALANGIVICFTVPLSVHPVDFATARG